MRANRPRTCASAARVACAAIACATLAACGRQDRPIDDAGDDDGATQACARHEQCAADELCNEAACEPAYGREYRIGVTNVSLSRDHAPSGAPWDEDGTAPDPQICFALTTGADVVERCTGVEADTFSPVFDAFTLEVVLEDDQLFEVLLCDDDPGEPECWTVGRINGLAVPTLRAASLTLIPDDPARLDDWAVTLSFDAI
jgi:hypothetical protein